MGNDVMPAEKMPTERAGRTAKLEIRNERGGGVQEGYVIANVNEQGEFKELFLQGFGKDGSTLYGWTQTVAILFSIGLQGGMDFHAAALKIAHQCFEPYGKTNDPEIPWCPSVPSYIVLRLGLWFGDDQLKVQLQKVMKEMGR